MTRNSLQPLHAAIKQVLLQANGVRPKSAVTIFAALALSATVLSPQVSAADYSASNETELRDAINDANGDADASATITLTGNVTMASTTAFATATKPITINVNGFTLTGFNQPSGTANGGSVAFTGVTIVNSGDIVGGAGFSATNGANGLGGVGLSLTNGSLTNNGTITGGRGADSSDTSPSTGGVGVALTGGTHVNNGTITGGLGGLNNSGDRRLGIGGVTLSNGSLTNNGTIQSSALVGFAGGTPGVTLSGNSTLQNNGTILGSLGGTNVSPSSNLGLSVSGSGTHTITNTGTIEGGTGGRAIQMPGAFANPNVTLINSGTIRAGGPAAEAIVFTGSASVTNILELQPGSVIQGNVVGSVANVNDTLRLGGSTGSDLFDMSNIGVAAQYRNFNVFQKTGTNTWTLTGTTSEVTPWQLQAGTLSVSSDANLGGAAGGLTFNGGILRVTGTSFASTARSISWGASGGGFDIADAANSFTLGQALTGNGSLTKSGAGTLVLTGNNSFTGATNVNAGTLRVNGNQSTATGLTTVASGATLGGSGTIGGAVTIADGGHLAPGNSPGTLNMGALTLNSGSVLDFELGEANVVGGSLNDLLNVTGDLVLDGTLNVTPSAGGTFGVGVYRLINYTGTLTDNGLELGLTPAGSNNYIQTSFANQVNLVNTQGLVLNYWDGAADARNNDAIGGGNGVWQAARGNDNWTTIDGLLNAGYASGSVAIFDGSAGTVTVDASAGDVRVTGMQFATDGYRIEGDAITLTRGLNSVRVGDATDAGSAFTATIASALTGDGTLDKSDLGTLVLTGENTYSGGTRVSSGTLQIGDGGTSGSIGGDVTNEAVLAFNRSDAVTFGGVISGAGSLRQIGAGSTILTGANTYTGATTITAGTLALSGTGSIEASSGVANDGTFDISASDTGVSITTLSGSGSVVLGSKALTLSAQTGTFAGVIDGASGTLNIAGDSTWKLDGAGSQVNTLNVQTGTLELGSGAGLQAQSTTISAGATLRNNGTLTGTAGNDTVMLAGTFAGAMNFLDGDDRVQASEGASFSQAAFDGGAGADTLELIYGSAFTLPETFVTTGFERLIKRGNGVFTLAGTVDGFSDSITVNEGSLQLSDANIVTSELRIESDATVRGAGSLSGNFTNAGVLSPGNSPGTIHVAGNYTQGASGTLISEITRAGTDLLDVSGTATLAGAHRIEVEYGLYLDGTTHTLIEADGGISGAFDSAQINGSALIAADRTLGANAVSVSFTRQAFTTLADPSTGRGRYAEWLEEQISAGNADSNLLAYIDALLQQPTAEGVNSLLRQQSEPVAAISQNSVSILGAGFARTVFDRFTVGDTAQCTPANGASDAVNCAWAHGLRQWGDADGDAFGSAYDWTAEGGQIGVDRPLSSTWSVGATFGYADSDIRDVNDGRNELRSRLGGLYANYAAGPLSVGAMVFYSGNENRTSRNVTIGAATQRASADFDTDSYGVGARFGYRLTSEAGPLVRPFIETFYDRTKGARVSERNAGTGNLAAHVHDRDGLRGTLGLQLAQSFDAYGREFRPALEVGVVRQFGDVRSTLDLQPAGSTQAFRTYGSALDRTAYVGRASLDVSLGANAVLSLGYGGELADDYSQHEGNLSFRFAW